MFLKCAPFVHSGAIMSRAGQPNRTILRSLLIALLGAITVFHVLTIRPGQGWGDDWALYVAHARNLAEGRPYDQTGYIHNSEARYAPRVYPPGFPVLLAPVYAVRGMDLEALKIPGVISLIAALVMFAALATRWDGASTALVATALAGFHPFFRDFKSNILSDLPFVFLLLVAIAASERMLKTETADRPDFRWGVLVGFTWWLAYSVRTVGAMLPIAFVLLALPQRATRARIVAPLGVFLFLATLQALILQGPGDYLLQFFVEPDFVLEHARQYLADLRSKVDPQAGPHVARIVFWTLTGFAAYGAVRLWKAGHRLAIVFLLLYGATVLVWPFYEGSRLLIPVIPFYFLGCVVGVKAAAARLRVFRPVIFAAAGILILAVYVRGYTRHETIYEAQRIENPASQRLFQVIRTATPDSAVMIFKKPRALALYTGRRATLYGLSQTHDPWKFVDKIGATHFISVRSSAQDSLFLDALRHQRSNAVREVFVNDQFGVYELARRF
jgi:hypothetical protein